MQQHISDVETKQVDEFNALQKAAQLNGVIVTKPKVAM
jgi:hypothetical protein